MCCRNEVAWHCAADTSGFNYANQLTRRVGTIAAPWHASYVLCRALSSAAALTPDGVQSLRARLWKTRASEGGVSGSRDAGEALPDRRGCDESADEAMVRLLQYAWLEQSCCFQHLLFVH